MPNQMPNSKTAYRAVLCAQVLVAQRGISVLQQIFCEVSEPALVCGCFDLMTQMLATAPSCCVTSFVCTGTSLSTGL